MFFMSFMVNSRPGSGAAEPDRIIGGMPHITAHPPGSLCWFELTTTDQTAAKKFYQSIFGWTVEDSPMGPNDVYSIFRVDGRDAAAACTLRAEQRAQGVPPNWGVYIAVTNADASAKRAAELGAKVLLQPFDVMDSGRMSVIQDPTGAVFCLWQGKKTAGTGIAHEHGTVVWADLSTPDQVRAGKFYSDLLGWKMTGGKDKPVATVGDYFHIVNGEEFIGGVPPANHRDPKMPAHWMIYFAVPTCDATVAKATSMGARLLHGPMKIGDVRTIATLADPQGAVFAIVDSTH
jgi:hypothetical protein